MTELVQRHAAVKPGVGEIGILRGQLGKARQRLGRSAQLDQGDAAAQQGGRKVGLGGQGLGKIRQRRFIVLQRQQHLAAIVQRAGRTTHLGQHRVIAGTGFVQPPQ